MLSRRFGPPLAFRPKTKQQIDAYSEEITQKVSALSALIDCNSALSDCGAVTAVVVQFCSVLRALEKYAGAGAVMPCRHAERQRRPPCRALQRLGICALLFSLCPVATQSLLCDEWSAHLFEMNKRHHRPRTSRALSHSTIMQYYHAVLSRSTLAHESLK